MRSQVELSRKELERIFQSTSVRSFLRNEMTVHFSFDFAQQVNLAPKKKILCTLSSQPPASRPHILFSTEEVWDFWYLLRGHTTTS